MSRFPANAGIAIGPILFILALLGMIVSFMASSSSGFNVAGAADRVNADIVNQANLIRTKISECYMQYIINGVNAAALAAGTCSDYYPCSDTTNGTLVSALTCPNDPLSGGAQQSIWVGLRPSMLPQPSTGFTPWY